MIGGGINIDQQSGSGGSRYTRMFRSPQILTDAGRCRDACQIHNAGSVAWMKISLLVKHAVIWQHLLEIPVFLPGVPEQGTYIVHAVVLTPWITDDHRYALGFMCYLLYR